MPDPHNPANHAPFRIGELYHPDVRETEERSEYNFRDGGHELRLHYRHPSAREIWAVQSGPIQFGLVVEDGVLFFLYSFEGFWGECPYRWQAVSPHERTVPFLPTAMQQLLVVLHVLLIDAATGIIQAVRPVMLPPRMGRALHEAIYAQMTSPIAADPERFEATVKELSRFPTLWPKCTVSCVIPATKHC